MAAVFSSSWSSSSSSSSDETSEEVSSCSSSSSSASESASASASASAFCSSVVVVGGVGEEFEFDGGEDDVDESPTAGIDVSGLIMAITMRVKRRERIILWKEREKIEKRRKEKGEEEKRSGVVETSRRLFFIAN